MCKKLFYLLLMFSLSLFVAFTATACKDEHEHKWTYYTAKEATCSEAGFIEKICSCGEKDFDRVEPLGHDRDSQGACQRCGDGKQEHVHNYIYVNLVEPSCTHVGIKQGVCLCGEVDVQVVEAIQHNRNEQGECLNCGEGKVSHVHNYSYVTVIEASCCEYGFKKGTCICGQTDIEIISYNNVHKYSYSTISLPTCSEKGKEKGTCKCGETIFRDIDIIPHEYNEFGMCNTCDSILNTYTGEVIGVDSISKDYGVNISSHTSYYYIENICLTSLGVIANVGMADIKFEDVMIGHIEKEFSVTYPENSSIENLTCVYGIELYSGELSIYQVDGTYISFDIDTIRGLVITKQGVILVVMTNNSAAVVGKVQEKDMVVNASPLLYTRVKNEYHVVGVSDRNCTIIDIPLTHKGLPVTKIINDAFAYNKKITKVIVGDNVRDIGEYAFFDCENLVEVYLGANVKNIESSCFSWCIKLTTINLPSSLEYIKSYAFNETNLKNLVISNNSLKIDYLAFANISNPIFTTCVSLPKDWSSLAFGNSIIYYQHEWKMVNGIPTLIN